MEDYSKEIKEGRKKDIALWRRVNAGLVGNPVDKQVWVNPSEILDVLNYVGKHEASNHTFMPSGGGLDLTGASTSNEVDLIELNFDGSAKLVNPTSLIFHAPDDDPRFWYFRLETAKFKPTDVYDNSASTEEFVPWSESTQVSWSTQYSGEELVEVSPGYYLSRSHWDESFLGLDEDGYEIPLPEEARLVTRAINGGAYVIFSKSAPYNLISSTYDARHNRMDDQEFLQYIKEILLALKERESKS